MAKYKIIPSSRTIVQSPISIGHKAEKGVEAIEFDLTAWVETYGSGTATIVMKRWGDSIPYPVALEIDENNKATWTLSDIDTAKAGMAYAQLSYIVGETVVKKSDIYTFRVMDSLTGEGEPPEAYESWLEHLTHLAAEAMAEVLDIGGIVTDKTLTVDGGIADGKATGDALSALEDQFSEETDKLKADLDDKSPIITDNITTTAINKSVLTFGGNYYPSTTGVKTALNTQYWYEALALTDFQLWKDESFTYTSAMVAIYNNGEATSDNFVARYRKSSSEDTLPTSNNKLSITKGQLLVISCSNDAEFTFVSNGFPTGKSVFKNNVHLNNEQLAEVQDKMQVVCGTNAYNIKYGDLNIALAYTSRENTRADLWNFNGITKGAYTVLTAGTDIVGVVKEDGESDYMGGVHGDETNEEFHILADGVPVTQDVYCDRVDILMVSTLTRVSTGDGVLKRYVHIVINRNVIEIETTFKCLVDNFSVYSACAGGMWAYYEADKTFAMSNIGELVGTGSAGVKIQEDHALYTATAFLQYATVTCENLIGSNVDGTLGQAYYYGNESNPRMKLYLGMLKNVTWNAGDYWKGKSRYTIY